MPQFHHWPLLGGLVLIGAMIAGFRPAACTAEGRMPEVVEIVSASGRTFRGRISLETDATALHLATTQGTIQVTRPIAWEAIAQVRIDSRPATLEELVQLAVERKKAEPREPKNDVLTLGPSPPPEHALPTTALATYTEAMDTIPAAESRVAYLSASAHYKNFDADAAVDGLEVHFAAMSAAGHPVATEGHLEAELYVFRKQSFQDVPHGLGARFERISTWRIPLHNTHAHGNGCVASLPYQGVSPAEDGRIVPHGLLVLRLVVPGQGTFSASLDDVRLRPYSAVRDANELRGNARHVSSENPRYRPYRIP